MKKTILLAVAIAIFGCLLFAGCSNPGTLIEINHNQYSTQNESIETVRKNLLALADENGSPYFKSVTITENTGIFYNLRTVTLTTGDNFLATDIEITMPDTITKYQNMTIDGNVATAQLSANTDYSIMSESNNYGIIIGLISFLTVAMAVFVIIAKVKS